MERIYLDNNSTTRTAPEVVDAMLPWLGEEYGNPSSPHPSGARAADAVRAARTHVARLLGATPGEVVFTSGGSESINAAIHAAARVRPNARRVISTRVEHSAARAAVERLADPGREVRWIEVDAEGRLDRDALFEALDPECALVSLIWANNETGVVGDLAGIGAACRELEVPFHVDAVQAPGKLPIDVRHLGCDLLSISGHKFHGPKGTGALYVQNRFPFAPLTVGGPQEGERRAGTENVPGIVGLGRAAELAREHAADAAAISGLAELRDRLEAGIVAAVPGARVHGASAPRVANTTHVHFPGLDAAAVLALLGEEGVEASAGSACNAQKTAPSPVLLAMGRDPDEASRSLRFSLSRYTTAADVEAALARIVAAAELLGGLA